MAVDMAALVDDGRAETIEIRGLLADLPDGPDGWDRPTPAEGWSIADQVTHLAYFDDAALLAATDATRFDTELAPTLLDGRMSPDTVAADHRRLSSTEVLAWFDASRTSLLDTFAGLDPSTRVPWFGPPMSAASSLTARIMETWAHGQDVADALGVIRVPTRRLRHVTHIGVGARAFSYLAHGREVVTEPVRVVLEAPSGERWEWGPPDAANRVEGPAVDFALLVTQRRHRDDTALRATGAVADEWLSIAQAFAGPPGAGRPPARRSGADA